MDLGENCEVEAPTAYLPQAMPAEVSEIIANAGCRTETVKIPPRRRALTVEDMYGNAIEEDNPQIMSMPNAVMLPAYLNRRIAAAQQALELAGNMAEETSKGELEAAIEAANALKAKGGAADRTEIIKARIALAEKTKALKLTK